MQSKIDDSITLTDNKWAISVVRNGQHAIIIWEKIVGGSYELWRADLVKGGDANGSEDYSHKNYGALDKKEYEGEVRKSELTNAENMSKKAIYERFNLTKGFISWVGTTWQCSATSVRNMEQTINYYRNNPPKFHISGKGFNKNNAHNCITWVEEVLLAAGIQMSNSVTGDCIESLSSRAITSLRI